MPPRRLPKPWASRLILLEISWRNGTSSSMISCSPRSAMAAKNGAMEFSPSRCARAPPPMPFRSAHTLPTNSPCWVTPPNRNVLIWLNHGAMREPYFSGHEYCILANSACTTPKVLNAPCRLWPSGASRPGLMQLPSSVRTSMGFITLIPRGRSGQKKPSSAWPSPHLAVPRVALKARLRIWGAAPLQSMISSSPFTVLAQGGVGEEIHPERAVRQLRNPPPRFDLDVLQRLAQRGDEHLAADLIDQGDQALLDPLRREELDLQVLVRELRL